MNEHRDGGGVGKDKPISICIARARSSFVRNPNDNRD